MGSAKNPTHHVEWQILAECTVYLFEGERCMNMWGIIYIYAFQKGVKIFQKVEASHIYIYICTYVFIFKVYFNIYIYICI